MTEIYEPDSKFVERLEWQLASEFRRTNRLKSSGKIAISRRAVALTLMAGALMTGVAMTKAADLIKDSWRKKIEVARAETDVKLKQAHAEFKRDQAAKAETQASNGLIRQEEYQVMRLAAERSALDLEKSLLNLDEVKASGEAPRNELYSPAVGGRDFVGERLQIEFRELELNLELRRSRFEQRLRQLVEKGLVPGYQLEDFQASLADKEAEIENVQERLDLRKQFIAGNLSAQEVEIQDRITIANGKLRQWQSTVDSLRKQLDRAQALEAKGLTSDTSVDGLIFGLSAAQAELSLANLELDILKKVK